jgi:hypothetical protein
MKLNELFAGKLARSGAASEAARSGMEPRRICHHAGVPEINWLLTYMRETRRVVFGVLNALILGKTALGASYIAPLIDSIGMVHIYLSTVSYHMGQGNNPQLAFENRPFRRSWKG